MLDLDETLVFATEHQLPHEPDAQVGAYWVYLRPGLQQFFDAIRTDFLVAIWSSADDEYVEAVVQEIVPADLELQFVWARSRCTLRRDYETDTYVREKRLAKLKRKGWSLSKVIMVDDTPAKTRDNFGNAIYINPFEGATNDQELELLKTYLKRLVGVPNIREIEKRGWRNAVLGT